MRLVLLGAPGSGKSTQAKLLAEQLNIPQISTDDLLYAAVEVQTPLGRQAKTILNAGQLLPNELVLGMIRERLSNPDAVNGFILDGFPRNIEQTNELDKLLNSLTTPIQKTILIDFNSSLCVQRLSQRLICEDCGEIFNRFSHPPALDNQCNKCAGKLQQHTDDNETRINQRIQTYNAQILEVIEFYKKQDKLVVVDGNAEIKTMYAAMKLIFKSILLSSSIHKPASPKKKPVQSTINFTIEPEKKSTPRVARSTASITKSDINTRKTPETSTTSPEKTPFIQTDMPVDTEIKSAAEEIMPKSVNIKKKASQPKKNILKPGKKMILKKASIAKQRVTPNKSIKKKKKKNIPPEKPLPAQLKQLKIELSQVKAIDNDLIRKQFSERWEKDVKKLLKSLQIK